MRPNISTRASRVRLAPLALGLSLSVAGSHAPATADGALASAASADPLGASLLVEGGDSTGDDATGATTRLAIAAAPIVVPAHTRLELRARRLNVLVGSTARVRGELWPGVGGRPLELQRHDREGWQTIARTVTHGGGRFVLRYTPRWLLSERLRVLFAGDLLDRRSARPVGRLSSYRVVDASWYGGGGSLACGGALTSATLGVANKTLPCGTIVTLRYGARSVSVPVVDRGPFVPGREFDLTEATKRALGFEGVGALWSSR